MWIAYYFSFSSFEELSFILKASVPLLTPFGKVATLVMLDLRRIDISAALALFSFFFSSVIHIHLLLLCAAACSIMSRALSKISVSLGYRFYRQPLSKFSLSFGIV